MPTILDIDEAARLDTVAELRIRSDSVWGKSAMRASRRPFFSNGLYSLS